MAYEELDVNLDEIVLEGPSAHQAMNQASMSAMPMMGGTGGPVGAMPPMGQPGGPDAMMPESQPMPSSAVPGTMDGPMQTPAMPMGKDAPAMDYPMTYSPQIVTGDHAACVGTSLVYNGSFEQGFVEVPWGDVGRGWEAFTNGGAANYGFYDEQWDIVVADGDHGQLIEINSKAVYPTDADRYAGIAQRIGGLHPGEVYELTVRGGLRGEGNEEDPSRFAAQWGISSEPNWQSVDEWTYMDFGPIQVRTEPGPLTQYRVRFEAPAQNIVLFIRGWKKFAITNVEMDLNLDAISLRACDDKGMGNPEMQAMQPQGMPMRPGEGVVEPGMAPQMQQPMAQEPMPSEPMMAEMARPQGGEAPMQQPDMAGASCFYIVKPGDSLSAIAVAHDVSMSAIAGANGVTDPDAIYVGQKFEIPGCSQDMSMTAAPQMQDAPMAGPEMASMPERMPNEQGMPLTGDLSMGSERPVEVPPMSGPMLRPDGSMAEMDAPMQPAQAMSADAPQMQMAQRGRTYVVQPGDMLTGIALDEGINAFDLATANGIDNMNVIYVGQVLVLPN